MNNEVNALGWTLAQVGAPAPAAPASAPAATPARTDVPGLPADATSTGAATTGQTPGGTPGAPPVAPQRPGGMLEFMLPMLVCIVVLFLITSMSGRKQRKQQQQMLASLSTKDRVQTVGGILGTIAEIHDDEIVLVVHEGSNSRMTIQRAAVQAIVRKVGGSGAGASSVAETKPASSKVAV